MLGLYHAFDCALTLLLPGRAPRRNPAALRPSSWLYGAPPCPPKTPMSKTYFMELQF